MNGLPKILELTKIEEKVSCTTGTRLTIPMFVLMLSYTTKPTIKYILEAL